MAKEYPHITKALQTLERLRYLDKQVYMDNSQVTKISELLREDRKLVINALNELRAIAKEKNSEKDTDGKETGPPGEGTSGSEGSKPL